MGDHLHGEFFEFFEHLERANELFGPFWPFMPLLMTQFGGPKRGPVEMVDMGHMQTM